MWWILIPIFLLILVLYIRYNPHFGGKLTQKEKVEFEKSVQWNGKIFENKSITTMDVSLSSAPGLIRQQFKNRKSRTPKEPIPILPFVESLWMDEKETPTYVWYGHSVILLRMNGMNILIDPMLGPDAAPIAPFEVGRFSKNSLDIIDSLPSLDAILMSHDHYDHLDYKSMQKLLGKTSRIITALGVGRHLKAWGYNPAHITEMDWWDTIELGSLRLTFTPTRHFSGRGITDRSKSLWGGFAFISSTHRVYWSGDSGYDTHFKEIGEKLGPFDIGFMECGQYNQNWHQIHMFPEESIQAAIDARVSLAVPIHWGAFSLSLHSWKEPVERFESEALKLNKPFTIPKPGEIMLINHQTDSNWWKSIQ